MDEVLVKLKKHRLHNIIYLATLFFSFHYSLIVYINSSFLENRLGNGVIGILYTLGSILNIIAFLYIARLLRRYGNRRLVIFLTVLEIILLFFMATRGEPLLLIAVFIIHQAIVPIIAFNLDVFLEHYTRNGHTGGVRATFYTISNLTFIPAPYIVGLIVGSGDYRSVYFVSLLFLIPFYILVARGLTSFKDSIYTHVNIKETWNNVKSHKNIRGVFLASLFLQIFYAIMTIYTPIYLNKYVGFSWPEIGLIFSIMLIPFVLFELPLGKLADKKWGEKEILIAGFIITAITTSALVFINSKSLILWATMLFLTRVGASFIEIMTESYFFKQINSANANLISFFRITRPLAYIIGPLVASILLLYSDFRYVLLIGATVAVLGIFVTVRLKDTK